MSKTSKRHAAKRYHRVHLGSSAQSTCPTTGKRQFASIELADKELRRAQTFRKVQRNTHVEKSWFLCAQCGQYHLTSQENR